MEDKGMKASIFDQMDLFDYYSLVQKIESYCFNYQMECEKSGLGTKYRTYREVSRKFSLTYDQLKTIIDDSVNLMITDSMSEHKGEWEVGFIK